MEFRNIPVPFEVYVLDKRDGIKLGKGKVVHKGQPTPQYPAGYTQLDILRAAQENRQASQMAIDMKIEYDGVTYPINVWIDQEVGFDQTGDISFATSKEEALKDLENTERIAKSYIENIPKVQKVIEGVEPIKEELNPNFAEAKQNKLELDSMKNEMSELKSMMSNMAQLLMAQNEARETEKTKAEPKTTSKTKE